MFFCVSLCTISAPVTNGKNDLRPVHCAAALLDIITAVALLVVGICATQWHFMPVDLQYALIGAGSAYSIALGSAIGLVIKSCVTEKTLC